jgi:hypothetical protein
MSRFTHLCLLLPFELQHVSFDTQARQTSGKSEAVKTTADRIGYKGPSAAQR